MPYGHESPKLRPLRDRLPVPKEFSPREAKAYLEGARAGNRLGPIDGGELTTYALEVIAEREARAGYRSPDRQGFTPL